MLSLLLLSAPYALAAEAGALRGQVLDTDGLAVPDAVVTLSGAEIGGELVAQSDGDGRFRFLSVPIGTHDVLVTRPRFTTVRTTVTVRLGESAYLEIELQVASTAGAEIVVEARRPSVDTTSSGVSANLSREALDNLPTGRSYQDAINLLPGVYGNVDTSEGGGGDGNPSVRGEGQYGNNYFIDGVSTRDPTTKTFGNNVNFDAIEEIQVYTDGAPAEFGQFTGMLVNVVTRDGGDEHHGSAAYYLGAPASFRPESCTGKSGSALASCLDRAYMILDPALGEEVPSSLPRYYDMTLSLTAGGPIKKETLWYFAALDLATSSASYPGMPVDQPTVDRGMMGWAKFTWFPSADLTVRVTVAGSSDNTDNSYTTPQYAPEAQVRSHSDDSSARLNVNWTPWSNGIVEAGFGYLQSHFDSLPQSGSRDLPSIVNIDTGEYYGNADSYDLNQRSRVGGELKVTALVPKALGSHKFKAGTEAWVLDDSRELIYTGPGDGRSYEAQPSAGLPCTEASGYTDCAGYTQYDQVGAMKHRGLTFAAFLQDDWQPINPLTLNVGVRVDRESLYPSSDTPLGEREPIVDQWMPAPRLGAAWDVTNDSRTLLSANWGRYFDVNGNSFSEWGDERSAYSYYEYTYDPAAGGYVLSWVQDSALTPSVYDEDLQPAHMNKLTLVAERELVPQLSVALRGMTSRTNNIPEDVNIDDSHWSITNPGAEKFREYRAIELVVERAFDNGWQLMGSYTLSESKGHAPGQFELPSGSAYGSDGNGVGVYLDDVNESKDAEGLRQEYFDAGYGSYLDGLAGLGRLDDDAGYYGYLPYHSFHMAKLSGSYTFDQGTTLGLSYMFDSGHAWEKHTYVPLYGDYYGFGEGRGTRWMPAVHYVDIRLAHAVTFNEHQALEVSVDIFNVPNFDTPVTYYSNDDQNFGETLFRQSPRAIQAGLKFSY